MSTQESSDRDPSLWQQGAAQRAQFLGPATALMLDLANLQEGSRVLDVAAGTGEQSLLAAQRLGVRGRVLAVDLFPVIH
jgi:cyclopropane fatty-acyl-phospholipid synthase-like methyltransferase